MRIQTTIVALAAGAFLSSTALADVSFYTIGSRLATRLYDDDSGQLEAYERVFSGELDLLAGQVFGDEPGYRDPPGIFSSSGTLTISIRAALRRWTGSGFGSTTDRLNIQQFGGAVSVYTPAADPANPDTDPLTHFNWNVGPGELHEHPDYYLVDSTLSGNGAPGIYLAEFHAEVNVDGLARSYPFFQLFNYGQTADDLAAATDYTEENIVPAGPTLGIFACLLPLRRRRR